MTTQQNESFQRPNTNVARVDKSLEDESVRLLTIRFQSLYKHVYCVIDLEAKPTVLMKEAVRETQYFLNIGNRVSIRDRVSGIAMYIRGHL